MFLFRPESLLSTLVLERSNPFRGSCSLILMT
jgi:hypothetical protein